MTKELTGVYVIKAKGSSHIEIFKTFEAASERYKRLVESSLSRMKMKRECIGSSGSVQFTLHSMTFEDVGDEERQSSFLVFGEKNKQDQ